MAFGGFGGGFGAARQPTTGGFGAAGFGGFGAPAPAPVASLSFGVAPAPAPTGFGTAFGAAPAPALSFGAAPAPSPAPAFGGFGAPAPAPAFGAPAFGAQPAPAFGAPAPAPAAGAFSFGGFGAAPAQAPAPAAAGFGGLGGGFGGFGAPAPAPAPAAAGFGALVGGFGGFGAPAPAPAAAPGGLFGQPAASTAFGGFGGAAASGSGGTGNPKYTPSPGGAEDTTAAGARLNYLSIETMPAYTGKTAEELRWEDKQKQFYGKGSVSGQNAAGGGLFGGQPGGGAFGSPAAAPGGFGAAARPAFGGFGATPAPAPAPAFGGFGTAGAFGAPAPAPAPAFGGFGAPAPAPAPGGFSFGAFGAAPAPAPAPAFGGFGAPAPAPAAAPAFGGFGATGAFGAPAPAPAPAFGGFGAAPAPAPAAGAFNFGAFGAAPAPAPAPAFGGFGTSAFGAPAPAPAPAFGGFGAAPAPGAFNFGAFGAPAAAPPVTTGTPAAAPAPTASVSTMKDDPFGLAALQKRLDENVGGLSSEDEKKLVERRRALQQAAAAGSASGAASFAQAASPSVDSPPLTERSAPRFPARSASRSTPYGLARASQSRLRASMGPSSAVAYTPSPTQPQQNGSGSPGAVALQSAFDQASLSPQTSWGAGGVLGRSSSLPTSSTIGPQTGASSRKSTSAALMGMTYSSPGALQAAGGSPLGAALQFDYSAGASNPAVARLPSVSMTSSASLVEALQQPVVEEVSTGGAGFSYRLNGTLVRALKSTQSLTAGGRQGAIESMGGLGQGGINITVSFPPDLEAKRLHFLLSQSIHLDGQQSLATLHSLVPEMGRLSAQQKLFLAALATVRTVTVAVPSPSVELLAFKSLAVQQRRDMAVDIVREYRSICERSLAGLPDGWGAAAAFAAQQAGPDLQDDACVLCPVDDDMDMQRLRSLGGPASSIGGGMYPSLGPALGAGPTLSEEAVLDVITLADEHFVLTANNMVLPEETEEGPLRLADVGLTRSGEVNAVYTDPSPPPAFGGAGTTTGGQEPAYTRSQAGASPGPLSPSALAGDGRSLAAWDRYERARAQRPSLLPNLPDVRDRYETSPSCAEFLSMSEEQVARAHNFTVSHPDLGSITWLEPVDLRGLNVRGMVTFDAEAMTVFVRGRNMEDHGPLRQDLNFPARITLQATEADGAQAREIERELRAYCAGNGSMTYEQYDPVRGLFTFRVEHFSGYGLPAHLAARKKARTGAESSASNQSFLGSSAAPLSVSALGAATGPIGHPLGFRTGSEAVPPLAVQPSRSIAQVGVGGSRMAEGLASYAAGASSIMQEDRLQDSAAHLLPSFKRAAPPPVMGATQGAVQGRHTHAPQMAVPPATPAQSLAQPTPQQGAGTGLAPLTEVRRAGYGLPAHLRSASRTASHSMARSESTAMSVEGADGAWGGEAAPAGGRSVSQSMLGSRPAAPPATPATHTVNGMHITAEELAVAQRTDTMTYVQREEGGQQELVGPFALPATMSRFGPTTEEGMAVGDAQRGVAAHRSVVDVSVKLLSEWEGALREVEARSAAAVKSQEDASKPGKDQSLPDPDTVPPPAGYPVKRAAWLPVSGPAQGEVNADAEYAHQAHIAYRGAAPVAAPSTSHVPASHSESAWPWARASLIQQKAGEGVGTKFGVNIVNHPTEALEAETSQALLFKRSFRASIGPQGLVAHRGLPLNKSAPGQSASRILARPHPSRLAEDFEQTTVQAHQAALVGGTARPIAATRPLQVEQARGLPAVKPCRNAEAEASRIMSVQEMLQYHGRHWIHVEDSAVLGRHPADAPTWSSMLLPLREFHSGETTGRLVIEATPQGLAVRSVPPGGTDTFDVAAICCPALPSGDQLLQHVERLMSHAQRKLQRAQSQAIEARHQEAALQGRRMEAGAAAHTVRLWHLVRALFGPAHDQSDAPFGRTHGMPHAEGSTPQAVVAACLCDPALAEAAALVSSSVYVQYERSMARKARLCDWLHASLAPMNPVAQSIYPLSAADCASGRWKLAQVHAGILAALLRHDVDTAVEIAVRSGHSLLSVLCASVGGVDREGKGVASGAQDEDVKDMIFAQLRSWASKPSTAPSAGVMAAYMLLAGAVSPASAQGIESSGLQSLDEAGTGASPLDLSKVHWLQALAAHMWYGQPVTSTLADVLASYDSAVQAQAASVPCPWYAPELSSRTGHGKSKDAVHFLAAGASTQPAVCAASMTYKEEALEVVKELGLPPPSLLHAQAGCKGVRISEAHNSKAMDGISAWREALSHMGTSSISEDGSLVLEPARDALFAVLQLGVLSSSGEREGGDQEDARHWVQVALEATSHGPSVADVSISWQLGMVLLSFTSASHRSAEARRVVLAKRRAEKELNKALQGLGQAGVAEEVKAQLLAVLTPAYARSSITATSQPLWGMPLRQLASLACDYADALAAAGAWHWAVHVLQTTAGAIAAASINQPGVDDRGAILGAPLQSTLVPDDASHWVRALLQAAHDVTLRFVPSVTDELLLAAEQLNSACAPELSARLQAQGPVCAQGSRGVSQGGLPAPDALHVCHRAAQAVDKDELGGQQLTWPARAAWLLHYGLVPRVWLLQAVACRALSEAQAGASVAIPCLQALLDPACAHEVKASQALLTGGDTALAVPLHDWAAAALARVVTRQVAPALLCAYESALALARLQANRDPSAPQEPNYVHPPTLPSVAGLFTGLTTVCPYSAVPAGADAEVSSGPGPGVEVLPTGYPGAVRTVLGLPDLAHALTVLQSAAVAGMVSQAWCRSQEYKQSVLLLRWIQQRHPAVLPPALRQVCDMQAVQSSAKVWLETEQTKAMPFRVKAGQDVSMEEARPISAVAAHSHAWQALLVDSLHGVVEAE